MILEVKNINRKNVWLFSFLLLVLASNIMLYRSPLTPIMLSEETKGAVIGSLIDFAIVMPILVLILGRHKKKFSIQRLVIGMAGGIIAARFIIPAEYFEPFVVFSYVGFAIEGALLLFEVYLIGMLVRHLPSILAGVRSSDEPLLFAFPEMVHQKFKNARIIEMITSEFVMFYYAFATWRKKPSTEYGEFTLYKNSSLIAFNIMMIHAIAIETIGIHWWLHDKSIVLSLVLLLLNIYSIFFFLADIQALRLHPVKMTDEYIYLSLGMMKTMKLSYADIENISVDKEKLTQKLNKKTTIDFVARDFEVVYPHVLLNLRRPCKARFYLGFEKQYDKVAIRMDDPTKFLAIVENKMER